MWESVSLFSIKSTESKKATVRLSLWNCMATHARLRISIALSKLNTKQKPHNFMETFFSRTFLLYLVDWVFRFVIVVLYFFLTNLCAPIDCTHLNSNLILCNETLSRCCLTKDTEQETETVKYCWCKAFLLSYPHAQWRREWDSQAMTCLCKWKHNTIIIKTISMLCRMIYEQLRTDENDDKNTLALDFLVSWIDEWLHIHVKFQLS